MQAEALHKRSRQIAELVPRSIRECRGFRRCPWGSRESANVRDCRLNAHGRLRQCRPGFDSRFLSLTVVYLPPYARARHRASEERLGTRHGVLRLRGRQAQLEDLSAEVQGKKAEASREIRELQQQVRACACHVHAFSLVWGYYWYHSFHHYFVV